MARVSTDFAGDARLVKLLMNRTHAFWVAILTVLCLAAGFAVWRGRLSDSSTPSAAPVVTRSPEEIEQAWKIGVEKVILEYEQDHDAAKGRNSLIALTVPGERREIHLALVLALEGLQRQQSDAPSRWQKALADFASAS